MSTFSGYAGVQYTVNGNKHVCNLRLKADLDPSDAGTYIAELQTLATTLGALATSNVVIDGYNVYNVDHELLEAGLLPTAVTGSVAVGSGNPAFNSFTVTMTGKGPALSGTTAGGNALLRFVVSGGLGILDREKFKNIGTGTPLASLAAFLQGAAYVWADYYGHTPTIRPQVALQFNAALQRRLGS